MVYLGIDIGGTNIKAGLVSQTGLVLAKSVVPFPSGKGEDEFYRVAARQAFELMDKNRSLGDVAAVGACVPGSLTQDRETVIHAYNLDFHGTRLREGLSMALNGLPVTVLNDADAATLAEHRFGALRGTETAAMFTLGTGVGGGLILNGRLFNGGSGRGIEPGHMCLNWRGELHNCGGRGCFEAYCNVKSLMDRAGGAYTIAALFDAYEAAEGGAEGVVQDYMDALSSALAGLANILDPERIALGGGIAQCAGQRFFSELCESVKEKSFFKANYPVVKAELGNDAGFIGAVTTYIA